MTETKGIYETDAKEALEMLGKGYGSSQAKKGFDSPNYTQTPNDFFPLIPEMGDAELRVTLIMIRNTFGFHKNGFKMGVSKLAIAAGLSRQGALDGAEAAENRGTFRRTNPEAIKEAEWELVVTLQPVEGNLQPVEDLPQDGGGQVGVKESIKKSLNKKGFSKEDMEKSNQMVNAMIVNAKRTDLWKYRENFREEHLLFADWWHEVSGQPITKEQVKSCQKAFGQWDNQRIKLFALQEAFSARVKWKKVVADPNELTKDAAAIQALPSPNTNSQPPARKFPTFVDGRATFEQS